LRAVRKEVSDTISSRSVFSCVMRSRPYFFPRFAAFFLAGAFLVDFDFVDFAMVVISIGITETSKEEVQPR
jgi:hypothetical protein